ncbi:MAG: helix-turn-helix transcriptional regulator [Clostridia bacterium]|nr:helix-turn-helix transcriptional regulator [Oscillospiraceae bacterium]MBP3599910.1 helix-turn-helix transcriptional regulator [Clostridia bacterium]
MKYTERIRALREDRDINQTQIAKLLNICQKTYSDYELGKTRIPIDSIIILAKFYDVDLNYICGITEIKSKFPKK